MANMIPALGKLDAAGIDVKGFVAGFAFLGAGLLWVSLDGLGYI